jgi:hypothetical protein
MTPEEALKVIKALTGAVDEDTSPRGLWLTLKNVRELAKKGLAPQWISVSVLRKRRPH